MRSHHAAYGPCLTDVIYSGKSLDGKITMQMEARMPRTDDHLRCFHRFRYDVKQPVSFSRLAFYQVGTDFYNTMKFDKLAFGDQTGMKEEFIPASGGNRYHRQGIPLS